MVRPICIACLAALIATSAPVHAEAVNPALVKADAKAWLRQIGADEETLQEFQIIWAADQPILARLTRTFELGDRETSKVMANARDESAAAPTEIPKVLTQDKASAFYRDNLGLAYAKVLVSRRIHEEALEVLKIVNPDRCVDPAGYHFYKGVAEFGLSKASNAKASLEFGLMNARERPIRYERVANLVLADMEEWQGADLGSVKRYMDHVGRRLHLARGGKSTQQVQELVIYRLDEIIKKLEEEIGFKRPKKNMEDEKVPDEIDLSVRGKNWGMLPEKERIEVARSLIPQLPPSLRQVAKEYADRLSRE